VVMGFTLMGSLSLILFAKHIPRPGQRSHLPGPPNETTSLLHPQSELVDSNEIGIGDLELMKKIGKGSFGEIWKASWGGTIVAIKRIPTQRLTPALDQELQREASLMKSLRHPNVLQFFCAATDPVKNEFVIVMEYMPRGSLYNIIHNNTHQLHHDSKNLSHTPTSPPPLPLPEKDFGEQPELLPLTTELIKSIALDTARGMNYLHNLNPPILHRDLKSHNLLVDEKWMVKVCDFGLSTVMEQFNTTMTACGTPAWTAPEVLRTERYTTKCDVYSFGVVLWEMFSRADPFPQIPPFQIVFLVGNQGRRPQLPNPNPWPPQWVQLISECWSEDPKNRPSFEQLLSRLKSL